MSDCVLLPRTVSYQLPRRFCWDAYIDIERELWALFPETTGRRTGFIQVGLTAHLYTDVPEQDTELGANETYLLLPGADGCLRPVRMQHCRTLTRGEYRMAQLTAVKLLGALRGTGAVMEEIAQGLLGDEVLDDLRQQCAGSVQ